MAVEIEQGAKKRSCNQGKRKGKNKAEGFHWQ